MVGDDQPVARRIDQVCDAFESRWRCGESPSLRDYLDRVAESERSETFSQLLGIELFWRQKRRERPALQEYVRSFPQLAQLIHREFGEMDGRTGSAGARSSEARADPGPEAPTTGKDRSKRASLGNYVVLSKIGSGGMGQVYKARHERMKRIVALKVLSPKMLGNKQAAQRFQREVEAAARLVHPHIVTAYDAGEERGISFLVMEYVEGRDLGSHVRSQGPLDVAAAVDCMLQAARGLEFAHQQGVVHRDIKPENLLRDKNGTVKILDMGLARLSAERNEAESAAGPALTAVGEVMGTFDYMAPEQAEDSRSADVRADVYSLGCTLYFLLTGEPVFKAVTLSGKIVAHRERAVPSLCEARSDVPARLDEVFRRMVAKNPEDRHPTMSEVVADLGGFGGGETAATTLGTATDDTELSRFLEGISPRLTDTDPVTIHTHSKTASAASIAERGFGRGRRAQLWWVVGAVCTALLVIGAVASFRPFGANRNEAPAPAASAPTDTSRAGGRSGSSLEPMGQSDSFAARPQMAWKDEREAAIWVLDRQGSLRVIIDGVERDIPHGGSLAEGNVQILEIDLSKADSLRAEQLERLKGLTCLGSLSLPSHVTDAGMDHLPEIPMLTALSLSKSGVTDDGLDRVTKLENLNDLDLSYTQVSDEGLRRLETLRLSRLTLTGVQITDDGLKTLASHPLELLNLSETPITSDGVRLLTALPKLSQLFMQNCNVSGDGLAHLSRIESLTALNLAQLRVDNESLRHLQKLSNLTTLNLSFTDVTDDGLRHLQPLNLRRLSLLNLPITDQGLVHLSKLTGLVDVNLEGSEVSDQGLQHLASLRLLTSLNLKGTSVTEAGIADLKKALPDCQAER